MSARGFMVPGLRVITVSFRECFFTLVFQFQLNLQRSSPLSVLSSDCTVYSPTYPSLSVGNVIRGLPVMQKIMAF